MPAPSSPPRILLITLDVVGEKMAGPAIRAWELAGQLAQAGPVTLASKFPVGRADPRFAAVSFDGDPRRLEALARDHDVLLVQGYALHDYPRLAELGKKLVVDLYDPLVFESYPLYEQAGAAGADQHAMHLRMLDAQMLAGDFFVCANERQRDMWLGRFCALGRLTPALYAEDPTFRRLIDLVPFGLPDAEPASTGRVLRGVVPGIDEGDMILLWGGGVWDWFDPLTLIRAVAGLGRPDVKLFFLGVKSPNPDTPAMPMTARAIALAEELGVKDRLVFFNEAWVPYEARQAYLLEADAGVSAHFDSVETRFSFRTRILDYLWAGLPVLTTTGDGLAEVVAREGLGEALPYGDVEAWQRAIARLADDPAGRQATRARVRAIARTYRWAEVAKPLVAYCRAPWGQPPGLRAYARVRPDVGVLARKGWALLRAQGAAALWRKVRAKFGGRAPAVQAGVRTSGDPTPGR